MTVFNKPFEILFDISLYYYHLSGFSFVLWDKLYFIFSAYFLVLLMIMESGWLLLGAGP